MFISQHQYPYFYRSLARMMLMGLLLCWKMLEAQEIYDKSNSLFVAPGAEIHVVSPSPAPPAEPRKRIAKIRKARPVAKANPEKKNRHPEKQHTTTEAQENAHLASVGFTGKESSRITVQRQEERYGILTPGSYGKDRSILTGPVLSIVAKIQSAEDFVKHRYLYKESLQHTGISYSNSCRPPPGLFSSARVFG